MNVVKIIFSLCLFISFLFISCQSNKESSTMKNTNKTMDLESEDGHFLISAEVVKKQFVNKAGKSSDIYEYYLRRSIQDYFIKFCESKVSSEDIDAYLEKQKDRFIQTINVEVEFRDGEWDNCGDGEQQSRVGEYVVIHKIKG